MNVCTEIAEFRVIPSLEDEEFIKIVDNLEGAFHSKQEGFIDTELVKGSDAGEWIMIQHWDCVDSARKSSKLMMQEPITEVFRQALDVKTIKIRYLKQQKNWTR